MHTYPVRLVGWWAHNRDTRFQMDNGEYIQVLYPAC